MTDVLLGVAIIAALCTAIGLLSFRLASRVSGRVYTAYVLTVVAATVLFAAFVHGRLILARLLPVANVIVLGNWIPLGAAALVGAMLGRRSIRWWRRWLLSLCLVAVATYSLVEPMLGTAPTSGDRWTDDGVLLQSTSASCSACAAATLLRYYGIESTEAELMRLCFTGRSGTPTLGLYRGLKLKTSRSPLAVIAFRSSPDRLLAEDRWPVLLLVHLEKGADVDPRYESQWGWTPGLRHAVVIFGRVGKDRLDVGDPSIGRKQWTIDDLRVLWHGDGLRLAGR